MSSGMIELSDEDLELLKKSPVSRGRTKGKKKPKHKSRSKSRSPSRGRSKRGKSKTSKKKKSRSRSRSRSRSKGRKERTPSPVIINLTENEKKLAKVGKKGKKKSKKRKSSDTEYEFTEPYYGSSGLYEFRKHARKTSKRGGKRGKRGRDVYKFGERYSGSSGPELYEFGERYSGRDSSEPYEFGEKYSGRGSSELYEFADQYSGRGSSEPYEFAEKYEGVELEFPCFDSKGEECPEGTYCGTDGKCIKKIPGEKLYQLKINKNVVVGSKDQVKTLKKRYNIKGKLKKFKGEKVSSFIEQTLKTRPEKKKITIKTQKAVTEKKISERAMKEYEKLEKEIKQCLGLK